MGFEDGRETYTSGSQVPHHPLGVSITFLLVGEHGLVAITEGEVQGLGGEITDDVGGVSTPEGDDTFVGNGALEALADAIVLPVETARLEHFILGRLVEARMGGVGYT